MANLRARWLAKRAIVNLDNPVIEGSYIGKPGLEDPSYGFFDGFRPGPAR